MISLRAKVMHYLGRESERDLLFLWIFTKNYDVLPSLTCVSIKFLRLPPDCLGPEKNQLTVKKAYVVPSFVFCFLFSVAAGLHRIPDE